MSEPDRSQQRLVVQRTGRARDVTMQGRPYKVFPARLVQQQVLRNNLGATFLPAAEIEASVPAWNAIPVVERHPTRNGIAISARAPEVLDAVGIGFVFNAQSVDGALVAEIYLDADRVAALPDTASYVANAEQGETGELSTGFAANVAQSPGTYNGEAYDFVLSSIAPDHLALLPDERGACSVKDGCGLGVNVANCGGTCGCGGKTKAAPAFNAMSDDEKRSVISAALRAALAGPGREVYVYDVFSEDGYVVFSYETPGSSQLFRSEFSLGEDGAVSFTDAVPVRRVTTYQPIANADGTHPSEDHLMTRDQMIERLVANGTPADVAKGLNDDQLAVLCSAKPGTSSDPDASEALRLAHEYRRKFEALQNAAAPALEREARERAEMIDDLVFNEAKHAFTEKEIRAMDLPMLRRLHKTVFNSTNYAGLGGPVVNAEGGDFSFARRGILSGERGKSVLDKSEG